MQFRFKANGYQCKYQLIMDINNDTDLYGDLENHGMISDVEKLEKELNEAKTDNDKLRNELKEAQAQIECLNKDKIILQNNIVGLYNTAVQG